MKHALGRLGDDPPLPQPDACEEAIARVVVDAVIVVLGLFGICDFRYQLRLPADMQRRALRIEIDNIRNGRNGLERAHALLSLLSQFYNAGGVRGILLYLKQDWTWWKWVTVGVIMLAQLTVWFTTGLAFIAQVVLWIMNVANLALDSVACHNACRQSDLLQVG